MAEKHIFPTDITFADTPHIEFKVVQFRDRNVWRQDGTRADDPDKANSRDKTAGSILGSVYLPLPEELQNAYSLSWDLENQQVIETIRDTLTSPSLGSAASSLSAGALTILQSAFGTQNFTTTTPNPRKQPIFSGIEPRQFSFSYNLTPASEKEANIIESIVRFFTINSLPTAERGIANTFVFNYPPEFIIKFHNVKGFPKFDSLVCSSISTDYAPQTMQIMKSGHTVSNRITLNFLETTLRTKDNPGI